MFPLQIITPRNIHYIKLPINLCDTFNYILGKGIETKAKYRQYYDIYLKGEKL